MGLADLEEIDAEAWFDGKQTTESLKSLGLASSHFKASANNYSKAASACAVYQEWFPAERREEVTPDIEFFKRMVDLVGAVEKKLGSKSLPDLEEIHTISAAIRNEMVVGERKGLAHRGTRHHFPAGHK
jgi:hypothetical protein